MTLPRLETTGLIATIVWAALAFGGVYSWAYAPAYVAVAVIAAARIWRTRSALDRTTKAVAFACAVNLAIVALQLVPLPPAFAEQLSPNLPRVLSELDLRYAVMSSDAWHPLSIDPRLTARAWWCGAALALLLIALTAEMRDHELQAISRALLIVGVTITVAGVVQRASGTRFIYGFWVPEGEARPFSPQGGPFGPFINRNHFAGWMLIAVPIGVGYVMRLLRPLLEEPDLRRRIIWLATSKGSEALLAAFAVGIMTLGLFLTASRSGIAAFVAMLSIVFVIGVLRAAHRTRAIVMTIVAVATVAGAFTWAGQDVIVDRFGRASVDFSVRQRAWSDALRIFGDFRLVGTGTNTYSRATLLYEPEDLTVHYAQAHSDYLQLLAESGLVGGAGLVVMVMSVGRAALQRFSRSSVEGRLVRASALAGIGALALQEAFDFSLQMPAVALLSVVAVAMLVRPPAPSGRDHVSPPPATSRRLQPAAPTGNA